MNCVLVAFGTMVGATLAVHLGLFEAIVKVLMKISRCNMCASFWSCMVILVSFDAPLIIVPLLSIFMAYLSNWMPLLFVYMQYLYDWLWEARRRPK